MNTLLYLAPLLAVGALLASRKTTLLRAGIVGLVLVLPGVARVLPSDANIIGIVTRESLKGVWIAWQAVSVIAAGLLFHNVIKLTHPSFFEIGNHERSKFSYPTVFAYCFLLGPFFETTVGFGMGIVILIPLLHRIGLSALSAVTFSLFSQMLVPWGALGVGTIVGAGLAGIPLAELGVRSAILSVPLIFGYVLVFWRLAAREGWKVSGAQRVDDFLWAAALAGLLYMANRFIAVETGTLVSTGVLLILRYWRDARPTAAAWRTMMRNASPYVLLTALLLATRASPAVADALRSLLIWQPALDFPPFPVFYHVSFWLLVSAVLFGIVRRFTWGQWTDAISGAWKNARVPIAVTIVFVVMAQLMAASGIAAALAKSWVSISGRYAVLASPVFAAVAGFLTSSNIGSNAMIMPIQSGLANLGAYSHGWIAALQNTTGSNFTMLSAARVAMGCALLGNRVSEHAVYARAYPLGVAAIVPMCLVPLFL